MRFRTNSLTVSLLTAGAILALRSSPAVAVSERPRYEIQASVSLEPAVIEGTTTISFTNHSSATLRDAVVFLFPNRFAQANQLNDLALPFVHPEKEFDAGSLTLIDVLDDGYATTYRPVDEVRSGSAVRIDIAPLKPGTSRRLRLRFRTRVPHRFGGFGEFERQVTLLGGWHPYLAALAKDGRWGVHLPPPIADYHVVLSPKSVMQIALNGHFAAGGQTFRRFVGATSHLSLIASPRLLRATRQVGGTKVTLLVRPKRWTHRVVPGPDAPRLIMNAAEDVLGDLPPGAAAPPNELLLIEAPLRLHLIEPGEGMVVVSDRLFKTFGPLRDYHESHLVEGILQELARPGLAARESAGDYAWVSEGIAYELAQRYMENKQPERRLLTDWLDIFDFLAAVDRFEKVPKIPFVSTFFPRLADADPAVDRIQTFNRSRPPGRVILSKVRDLVGDRAFTESLDGCLHGSTPLRACLDARFPERGISSLLDEWNAPYPSLNYWIENIDFNDRDRDRFRTTVRVRRDASRAVREPVTIRMRTIGGDAVDVQWNSQGDVALIAESTPDRVVQVYIDPEEKLIETRRDDNAWLPRLEVLLDGADIEVSSTQFSFGANVVSRIYQDYRKDLALTAFYTNRGVGAALGPRFHFGEPIDVTRFRHNLHTFYSYTSLDSGFDHLARPGFVTKGHTAGLGFRYDYTDVFFDQNPSTQRRLRIHGDWYDDAMGSDFDYTAWGYDASLVFPVFSPRTLIGAQVINAFSHASGKSVVPNQGLYSLGGTRSIRGIEFGDKLGRNLFVVRGEVRQSIYPELDLNLLDIFTLRRTQVRAFVDAGNVANSAGRAYDPSEWAVGAGIGFGLVYDAVGFFPGVAFIEIATRVDDRDHLDDVQVLFGTKQSF